MRGMYAIEVKAITPKHTRNLKEGHVMKRKPTTSLIGLLGLLSLTGLVIWLGQSRNTYQTTALPTPIERPEATRNVTHSAGVTFSTPASTNSTATAKSLQQTAIEPTASLIQLTQKEVVFDPVNGTTMTLQPGLHMMLLRTDAGASLHIRNFDFREDFQQDWPMDWIIVTVDVRAIPARGSLEQFAVASRQNQIEVSQYQDSAFQYGALESIHLGLYRGYTYKSTDKAVDAPLASYQFIVLQLDDKRYTNINISNTDSADYAKVLRSLSTLKFAPKAS